MTASPSAVPSPSVPATHAVRGTVALLAATLVVLAAGLALPWWSETEIFGPYTWTQEFSPWMGVTAKCSPSCGAMDSGPPTGPLQNTSSFSSVGLHETGILYGVSLGLEVAGMVLTALALATRVRSSREAQPSRRQRTWVAVVSVALLSVAVGVALLPALQPSALRADTIDKLSDGTLWTASPSPETSFIGECQHGAFQGACASGGSAAWGPGLGWILLVVATGLLIVVLLRNTRSSERPDEGR